MNTIPKYIHYIWIGPKKMSGLQHKCISSWKKHLPESDWQYKLWNEETLPTEVLNHPYVQKMYARRKWSYVSDYIRFWALATYGGVYLDTDVEILKPFDGFLQHTAFAGKSESGQIQSAVIGTVAGADFIRAALGHYTAETGDSIEELGPSVLAKAILENSDTVQIYNHEYFFPFDFGEKYSPDCLTQNTYAIHWWDYSWGSPLIRLLLKLNLYHTALKIKTLILRK